MVMESSVGYEKDLAAETFRSITRQTYKPASPTIYRPNSITTVAFGR